MSLARLKYFLLNPNSNRESPIFLSISYSGKRLKLKTKLKIKPTSWNKKSNSVRKSHTEHINIQKDLRKIELKVSKFISDFFEVQNVLPEPKELKVLLENEIFGNNKPNVTLNFWDYYRKFIVDLETRKNSRTGKPISPATIYSYQQTLDTLTRFSNHTKNDIIFQSLSNNTYKALIEYFENTEQFSPNTVGKHIKNIKSVIASTKHNLNITLPNSYVPSNWKVTNISKPAEEIVTLDEEELRELYKIDLSNSPLLAKCRDIFLVISWTALRISDAVRLTENHVNADQGIIVIETKKNSRVVTTVYHPITQSILKKYNGKMPYVAEPTVNKEIKNICKNIDSLKKEIYITETLGNTIETVKYKRWEKVTTHTGRRSFATNMLRKEATVQQIMSITGHKKEADFYRYIGITNNEHALSLSRKFNVWYR